MNSQLKLSKQAEHILLWWGIASIFAVASALMGCSQITPRTIEVCLAAVIFSGVIAYATRPKRYDSEALRKLIPKLVDLMEIPKGEGMRMTFWIPDEYGEFLLQATPYWPRPAGRPKQIRTNQGLIGRVFQSQPPKAEIWMMPEGSSDEEYVHQLIHQFKYNPEEAEKVNKKQRSFAAIPVLRDDELVAIFYVDSSTEQLFASEYNDQWWYDNATDILSLTESLLGH